MNEINLQESLFEDPIGMRFRHGRERQRLSQEDVARKLHIPVRLIDAIEREDWARIGAPIYLRSHVGSYARLLGMPDTVVGEVLSGRQAPPLVPTPDVAGARRRMMDRGLLKLAYVVITLALIGTGGMLVTHFQSGGRVVQLLPLDPPTSRVATKPVVAPRPRETAANAAVQPASPAAGDSAPATMMASLAPGLPSSVGANELVLRFNGPSWLEVVDADGNRVERGLVPAGSERHYEPGQVARITYGNAGVVEASQGGRMLDLSAYRQAEVVRFAVSSQGQVTSPGD